VTGAAAAIATFTAAVALDTVRAALARAGTGERGRLRLLQEPSDNAVVHVPGLGLVARVAAAQTHRDRLHRELTAANWMQRQGFPAAEPAADPPLPQLTVVNGRVVSWWEYLPSSTPATYHDHGRLLARLHALAVPAFLPRLDPWARVAHQIALAALALPDCDVAILRREHARFVDAWTASPWRRARAGLVHGDPYIGNSLDVEGRGAVLLDFEDMAIGPAEWDVASVFGAHLLGWMSATEWEAFCAGYGTDASGTAGFEFLVDILASRRCCWFASRASRDPDVVDAARHRIATLHLPFEARHW